jgi:hypothetical protein
VQHERPDHEEIHDDDQRCPHPVRSPAPERIAMTPTRICTRPQAVTLNWTPISVHHVEIIVRQSDDSLDHVEDARGDENDAGEAEETDRNALRGIAVRAAGVTRAG